MDTTPNILIKEASEITEGGFRTLFNNLPIACFGYDQRGRIQIWNRAYEELYGLKAKDIVDHSILKNVQHPKDRQRRKETIRGVFGGRSFYGLQWKDRRADGSSLLVGVDTFPLRNTSGRIIMGISACLDITEQKRTEETLVGAAQEWRETFDAMADSVSIIDGACRIQRTNKATLNMLGIGFKDILGKPCYELYHGAKSPITDCPFQRMFGSRTSENGEFYLDERKQWVSITVNPLFDSKNQVVGGVHVVRNITRRKQVEKALLEERDRAQRYLDIAEVMLVALNGKGQISLINRKGCRILGYEEEELIGKNWFDTCLPSRRTKTVKQAFEKLIVEGKGVKKDYEYHENPVLTKTGEERTIAWRNTFLTDETGKVIGTLSSGEDITEREQLRNQLLQAEKMSALGQLISGVAHELNNPMSAVLGYSQLLLSSPKLPEPPRQNIERIYQEAERARKIVQNLLTFARQRKPEKKKISLNAIVERTLNLRAYEMQVNNIKLIKMFDQNIPSLLADEHQLQQVFMNIILNAEQAMLEARGRGRLEVRTRWDTDREVVQIFFQDDGPGVSEEYLSKVFDPFFTTKPDGEGTGLGLSISYGIVKEHGGHITVVSQEGSGATFTVELPLDTIQTSQVKPQSEPTEMKTEIGRKKILIIDDEASLTELVKTALEREGHKVETASDGDMAVKRIEKGRYDAVVSDLKMPGKSGAEVYLYCKQEKPHLAQHFLFLTGDVVAPDTMRFIDEQKIPCISKPFDLEDVISALSHLFQEDRQQEKESDTG